jgi:hypothetical protein
MPAHDLEDLARRFRDIVLVRLREDGLDSFVQSLESAEADKGGELRMQFACKSRKRPIPEAGFATERFRELG